MYSVCVYYDYGAADGKLIRYLVFETYTSAVNCYMSLTAREEPSILPAEWFEIGKVYTRQRGELIGQQVLTDWVHYYKGLTIE